MLLVGCGGGGATVGADEIEEEYVLTGAVTDCGYGAVVIRDGDVGDEVVVAQFRVLLLQLASVATNSEDTIDILRKRLMAGAMRTPCLGGWRSSEEEG